MTRDNNMLGKFVLEGIPPAKRGVPQIEVSMTCILLLICILLPQIEVVFDSSPPMADDEM